MLRTCRSCCIWAHGTCPITNRAIPEEVRGESFCDLHKYHLNTCALCGAPMIEHEIILESHKIVCYKCFEMFGTCATCNKQCSLEKDNTMPRTVFKTFQQGGITMQSQVLNPDLIQKHCPSCFCYKDNVCFRQKYNTCDKYEPIIS